MSDFYSGYSNQQSGQGDTSSGFYNQRPYGDDGNTNQTNTNAASSPYGNYGNPNSSSSTQPSTSQGQAPNIWQPSTINSSTNEYGQQQHQQQPSSTTTTTQQGSQQPNNVPAFWNPAVSAASAAMATAAVNGNLSDPNAILNIGMTYGRSFLDHGTAQMIPGLDRTMRYLRIYFAVDNGYVKRKMGKVLFSFFYKHWRRMETEAVGPDIAKAYALPLSDDNAFDLYIPSMSLITYVLLCALCYGNAGKFNPEVIPDVTTKCFVTQIIEVVIIRFGFYMMQAPIQFMDLFAVTGYKYLGLCVNMLIGLVLGHLGYGQVGYYATFFWTASAASYFMLKTMANNIPRVTAATGPKREFVVLGLAASQFATMWFLGQTKFLT